MSTVKLFKFIGGEEIVTKVVEDTSTHYVVEDAVTLVYQQTENGVSTGFAPFMPYAKGKIEVTKTAIVAETENLEEKVLSEYTRIFSGIVIASANSIPQ